jgi:hypothetical protein
MIGYFVKLSLTLPLLGIYWLAVVVLLVVWRRRLSGSGQSYLLSIRRPVAHSTELALQSRCVSLVFWALVLAFVPVYTLSLYSRVRGPLAAYTVGIAGVLLTAIAILRFYRQTKMVYRLRLERDGRLAVGRYLDDNSSIEQKVFHDYGTAGDRIDHVLAGPGGVCAVSTLVVIGDTAAARSGEAVASVDGLELTEYLGGRRRCTRDLREMANKARWLHNHIATQGCVYVDVQPVVIVPGRRVEIKKAGDVIVLNETQMHELLQRPRILPPSVFREVAAILDRNGRLGSAEPVQQPVEAPTEQATALHG